MTDLRPLPLPAFPSDDALAQLQQTPAPGPAVARALAQLPALAAVLVDAAADVVLDRFPFEPSVPDAREVARRDAATCLKLAAMNLCEGDDGRAAAARHQAWRAILAGADLPGDGEATRAACRAMADRLREELRGGGVDVVAREIGRVAVAATAEPPAVPMLAHVGTANPARHPSDAERRALLEKLPDMEWVAEATRHAETHEAAVVEAAVARVAGAVPADAKAALAAILSAAVRAAANAALQRDAFVAVAEAIAERVDPWAAAMIGGFLHRVADGACGAPPRYPDRRRLASLTADDPILERAVLAVRRQEAKIVADALAVFLPDHRKFLRPLGVGGDAWIAQELAAVVRAAVDAALTADLDLLDRRIATHRAAWVRRGLDPGDAGLLVRVLAAVAARTCPDAIAIAALVDDASEALAGAPAPPAAELPRPLAALLKREAKVARAAVEETLRAWPRAAQAFGRDVADKCLRDETFLLRTVVEAAATNDRDRFLRRVRRHRRVLDRLGFPDQMLAAVFPALAAAAAEPDLRPWFDLGAAVMDPHVRRPAAAPGADPVRRRIVEHLARQEQVVAREAVRRLLDEMTFLRQREADVAAASLRDEGALLRAVAAAVASGSPAPMRAHVGRLAALAGRVAVPRAAVRRWIELSRDLAVRGLDDRAAALAIASFDAAGVVAVASPDGHETLRHLLETFEGRLPDAAQRALLLRVDPACEPLLAALDDVAAAAPALLREITDAVFARFDYETAHQNARAKCSRDIGLVLNYAGHAALLGSPGYLADKLLHWLRTIFQSFQFPGKGESVLMTYTLLQRLAAERLAPASAALLAPHLQAAVDILPAPGIGARVAGAAAAPTW